MKVMLETACGCVRFDEVNPDSFTILVELLPGLLPFVRDTPNPAPEPKVRRFVWEGRCTLSGMRIYREAL